MKKTKFILLFICLLLASSSFAQQMKTHTVKKGETLYSISKQYEITAEDVINFNAETLGPDNVIKPRQVLVIPSNVQIAAKEEAKKELEQKQKDEALKNRIHKVQPKETVYGLSKQYGVTQEELFAANPQIKQRGGLQIAMELKIPYPSQKIEEQTKAPVAIAIAKESEANNLVKAEEVIASVSTQVKDIVVIPSPQENAHTTSQVLQRSSGNFSNKNVVTAEIILPFYLKENDSITKIDFKQIYEPSKIAISFYMGAKLAIDSLQKIGVKADIRVFDSGRSKANIEEILLSNNIEKSHIIIGPLYAETSEFLASQLDESPAMIVSPFSLRHNLDKLHNIIQITTPSASVITHIQKYIAERVFPQANVILLTDKTNSLNQSYELQKLLPANSKSGLIANISVEAAGLYQRINNALKQDKENIIIIPSASPEIISELTSVVENKENTAKIEVICYELDAKTKKYINDNRLSTAEKTNLTYGERLYESSSNPDAEAFRALFKKTYSENPNSYALQGFDLTFDMLQRFASYQTIDDALTAKRSEGLASKYYFIKTPNGGYFNHDCFILKYTPEGKIEKVY